VLADVAYVMGLEQYSLDGSTDTGLQHYDVGLIANYVLNNVLNVSRRYGEFSLQGYVYYTDSLEDALRADTQIWGGMGIQFKY
jgi:hypothetical protein